MRKVDETFIRLGLRLNEKLYEVLRRLAYERHVTVSAVLRQLVAEEGRRESKQKKVS